MAFLSDLIESFVPTLAFADEPAPSEVPQPGEEESKPADAPEDAAPPSESEEAPVEEEASPAKEEDSAPAEEEAAPAQEEEDAPADEESSGDETPSEESSEEGGDEPAEEKEEGGDGDGDGDGDEEEDEDEDDEDEDDEDEEEEGGDPLDKLRKDCATLPSIKPYLHHYEECVERVHKAQEDPGYEDLEYKEDCVEEFFHLQHHINDCVSPRLFSRLK